MNKPTIGRRKGRIRVTKRLDLSVQVLIRHTTHQRLRKMWNLGTPSRARVVGRAVGFLPSTRISSREANGAVSQGPWMKPSVGDGAAVQLRTWKILLLCKEGRVEQDVSNLLNR